VLPILSMRWPSQSFRLLLEDRSWLIGFAMETAGFLLYAAALALAPLALVQGSSDNASPAAKLHGLESGVAGAAYHQQPYVGTEKELAREVVAVSAALE
jgi:hypothetical protein